MKMSGKRLSPGWTFAAGTLFGAIAVVAPIASSGTSTSKTGVSQPRRPATTEMTDVGTAPRDLPVSLDGGEPAPIQPPPAPSGKTRRRPPGSGNPATRHSELELQLD